MLDAYRQHQRPTAPILSHFTRGIGIALHERHQTGGCECGIFHRCALGTYMAEVMPHTTATFH